MDTWLEAWSLYATVLADAKPHQASQLFQYQSFITRTSQKFHPYAWLQYDYHFRLKLAANPEMQWSKTDPELTAAWLTADATKARTPCFLCGSPNHLASSCPLKPSVGAPSLRCPVCNKVGHTARECSLLTREPKAPETQPTERQVTPVDDNFCQVYNKRGFCLRGTRCQYPHACSACRGGHPRRHSALRPGSRVYNSMRKITEIVKDYGGVASGWQVDRSVAWRSENVERRLVRLSLVSANS